MKHQIKVNRVYKAGMAGVYTPSNRINMHTTVRDIMSQIPDHLYATMRSKDIIEVCKAINAAYHSGRGSAGAERIDDTGVWLDKEQKIIDIESLI